MSEAELIRNARGGNSTAFGELIGPYLADLRKALRSRLGGFSDLDGDEILQDVLIKIWFALPKYYDRYPFRSFIFGIALMHVRKVLSNRGRRREIPLSELENPTDEGDAPTEILDRLLNRIKDSSPADISDPEPDSDPVVRETLTAMFGFGGYPHQLIAFGFSLLVWGQSKKAKSAGAGARVPITGNPQRVALEMRATPLDPAAKELLAELGARSSLTAEVLQEATIPFRYRLGLTCEDLFARDPTSLRQFAPLLDQIAGQTALGGYFGKDPAKSVMDWSNSVKTKTLKALRGEVTLRNSPLPWPEATRDAPPLQ